MTSLKPALATIFVIALLGISAVGFSLVPSASATSSPPVPTVTYSAFVPAVFSIYFPQTTIINVTVLPEAGGLYTYSVTTSPPDSRANIYLNDSDIYRILVSFSYPVSVSGNATWSLSSPGLLAGEGGNAPFYNQTSISLNFLVELIPAVTFPTADQIANATSALLLSNLHSLIAEQNVNQQSFESSVAFDVNVLSALVTAVIIIVAAVIFVVIRWSRKSTD